MKLKTFIRQMKRRMNINLLYFIVFSLIFIIHSFWELKFLSGEYFLSSIVGSPIWREILLGGVIYYFGYRFIKNIEGYKEKYELNKFSNIFSNFFLLFLGILALQSIFGQSIFGFDLNSYEYGKKVLEIVKLVQYPIVISAIVFGSLIFYINREEVESIENENEKLEEENRKKEFEERFPRLNKIPFIGSVCKWFWKEELKYSLGLVGIVLLGLILRILLADKIQFNIDEFYHLMSIENYQNTGILNPPLHEYSRSKFMEYIISHYFYGLTGNKLLDIRLFGIIIFSFFSFTLYPILKDIIKNKSAILFIIFIININFFLIIYSLFIRSYLIFFIFSFFNIYLFYKILFSNKKQLTYLILFLISFIISIKLGHEASFYHFLLVSPILFITCLIKNKSKKGLYIFISFLLIIFIYLTYLYYFTNQIQFVLNTIKIENIFNLEYEKWWIFWGNLFDYGILNGTILIYLSSIVLIFINKRKNYFLMFLVLYTFITLYSYDSILSNKNTQNRYIGDIIIPIIVFSSYFLYILYKIKNTKKIFIFFLILINTTNIILISKIYNGNLGISEKSSDNWNEVFKKIDKNSIILTNTPQIIYFLKGNDIKDIYKIGNLNSPESIYLKNGKYNYIVPRNNNSSLEYTILKNQEHYKKFINNKINSNFIVTENQQYFMYLGTPLIMSKEHFKKIILEAKEKNKNIYIIYNHNGYDNRKGIKGYIYKYFKNNGTNIIKNYSETNIWNNFYKSRYSWGYGITLEKLNDN